MNEQDLDKMSGAELNALLKQQLSDTGVISPAPRTSDMQEASFSSNSDVNTETPSNTSALAENVDSNAQGSEEVQHTENNPQQQAVDWSVLQQPIKVKGHELTFRDPKEIINFVQRNGGAVTKLNRYEQFKPALQPFMTNGEFDKTKLALANDVMKGNKQAILEVLKLNGIDAYTLLEVEDTDEKEGYKPSEVITADPVELKKQELFENYVNGQPYEQRFNFLINSVSRIRDAFQGDPEIMTNLLREEFVSGRMDNILNEIQRRRDVGLIAPYTGIDDVFFKVAEELYPKEYGERPNAQNSSQQSASNGQQVANQGTPQTQIPSETQINPPNFNQNPSGIQNHQSGQNIQNTAEKQRISEISNSKKQSFANQSQINPFDQMSPKEIADWIKQNVRY